MSMQPTDPNLNPLGEILQEEPAPQLPNKPKGNRTFTMVIAALIVLTLVALVFLVLVAPRMVAQQRAAQAEQAAMIYAANTATSVAATDQAYAAILALTPSATPQPTATIAPTGTPLLAQPATSPTPLLAGADMAITQTLGAMLTQVASTKTAVYAPTSTALPSTGLFDHVASFWVLLAICVILIAAIIILRLIRTRLNTR